MTAFGHTLWSGFDRTNLSNFITLNLVLFAVFSIYQVSISSKNAEVSNQYVVLFMIGVLTGITCPFIFYKLGLLSAQNILFFPGGRYKAFLLHQNNVGIVSSFLVAFFLVARIPGKTKLALVSLTLFPLLLCTSKFNLALSVLMIWSYVAFTLIHASNGVRTLIWLGTLLSIAPFGPTVFALGIKLLMWSNPEGAARIALFAENPSEAETLSERLFLWESAIINGTEALPFGVGVSNASAYLNGLSHAHNAFLNNYLVFGLPGLAHFTSIVFLCLIGLWRHYSLGLSVSAPLFAGFIGLLASNMSDSFSNTTALVVYPVIAMGWSIIKLEQSI